MALFHTLFCTNCTHAQFYIEIVLISKLKLKLHGMSSVQNRVYVYFVSNSICALVITLKNKRNIMFIKISQYFHNKS